MIRRRVGPKRQAITAEAASKPRTPITLASVVRFVEDNWLHGERLGGGSFDAGAGSIGDMFDFAGGGNNPPLTLDPATGTPANTPAAH